MRQRQEFRVFPIDVNKSKAVGIKVPFNAIGIFGLNYTTQEQVKTNLTNFMLTNQGERIYNVNYGAGLRELLFNPQGNTEEVRARIEDRIKAYFPQIRLNKLSFTPNETILYVTLDYSFNRVDDQLLIAIQL